MRRIRYHSSVRPIYLVAAAATVVLLLGQTGASASDCSDPQVGCPLKVGLSWVKAVTYRNDLGHPSNMDMVDVINLKRPCHRVRLYYLYGYQGDSHVVAPLTLRIRMAANWSPGGWTIMTPKNLASRITTMERRAFHTPVFTLPYPNSYWYVYVSHNEQVGLSWGGVQCVA